MRHQAGPPGTDTEAGILIASASAGTGHLSAAEALRAAMEERNPKTPVTHVDILELAAPLVGAAYGGGFEVMASRAPWLWREIYHRTDGERDNQRWGGAAARVLFRGFRELLRSRPWRLVLCTHFLPCQLAAGRTRIPFSLVVTDFALHRFWVQPGVGRYFVASPALAGDLRKRVAGANIDVTGIPIRPEFLRALPLEAARAELGLSTDRRTVLVMGGGLGIGVAESVEALLERGPRDLQILAVCGRNREARVRLEERIGSTEWKGSAGPRSGPCLKVFGHVDRIHDLMAAADLVVTKPGGLTCSEALALGRPLILTRPIPGHEEANVSALVAEGAALRAPTPNDVPGAVELAFHHPGRLNAIRNAARALGRPCSAEVIAERLHREFAPTGIA